MRRSLSSGGAVLCFLLFAATTDLSADPASEGTGEGQFHPGITIWVYNYAEAPQKTVTSAKMEIARILNQAEVMTEWIDCPISSSEAEEHAACRERMLPTDLAIMIQHKFKLPNGASRDTYLGSADLFSNRQPGHYIYMSYDHIRDSVYPGGAASPEILAEVAVHEIAHVLFRSIDHSPAGLMRARWDRQDLQNAAIGNLLFTPQQAEIIRAEVAARARLAETERNSADRKAGQ
jgi:hypothetical protein